MGFLRAANVSASLGVIAAILTLGTNKSPFHLLKRVDWQTVLFFIGLFVAVSGLEEQTEARLLENLSRLPGRTCLIVTHRKAALEICDYCLHMAHGALTAHLAKNEKKT